MVDASHQVLAAFQTAGELALDIHDLFGDRAGSLQFRRLQILNQHPGAGGHQFDTGGLDQLLDFVLYGGHSGHFEDQLAWRLHESLIHVREDLDASLRGQFETSCLGVPINHEDHFDLLAGEKKREQPGPSHPAADDAGSLDPHVIHSDHGNNLRLGAST